MKFKEFIKQIYGYESDTFSASAEELTKEESKIIAEEMLGSLMNNHIDGIWISWILERIRRDE